MQIWPLWNPQTLAIPPTAACMSQSSVMIKAPLPPSSMSSLFIVFPPLSMIFAPTIELPVKEIILTSELSTRAAPISGADPTITLTTPGGNIELRTSPNLMTAKGS